MTRSIVLCFMLGSCCRVHAQATDPGTPAAPARTETPAASAGPKPSKQELDRALARYRKEPSVERVVQAALRAGPVPRARATASRARDAGWVPKISLRARRGQAVDLSSSSTDDALRLSTDDDLTLEAALSFELDRVVFRSEEVALLQRARDEETSQQTRVRDVIQLYYERRRLQLERDLLGDASLARTVRIAEIEALLDVFTKGAFRRMMGAWTTAGSTPATPSPSQPRSSATARP